ncbi:MAG: efflux RND transporter permease subunit [Rhodobacteraceae bacterium]|nr:efflux RND transporter permease subunit [Paracoccaceae bacterium]
MDIIRIAIERPIAVIAAVLMAVMFGALSLARIPIQLTPDVRKPVIEVTTNWGGVAPVEVEREIVIPQEDELKGLEGLETMISSAQTGTARITLEFAIGTNMDRSLLLVSNRLDRVSGYPEEADEPTLDTSGSDDNPIAWMILKREPGNETPIEQFGDFVNDVVKERLERVQGIATVNVYGGVERELQVIVSPERLAKVRLTIPEIVNRLRVENISVSAGDVDEGKRRYVVRAEGELNTVEAVENVVLRSSAADDGFGRVLVSDIAEVRFGHKEPTARIRQSGEAAIAFNAVRDTGANVIETMRGLRTALEELRVEALPRENLTVTQVYDETVYIDGAIELVIQNIWIGGLMAAGVLLLFLRSPRATLVISLAIPVSIIASFVAMAALGRTLNVISLAGIAFAVGMVVDAAIVVLENIYRLRQQGMPPARAAYEGARQVWGAILVSALTTVLVFAPILMMDLEAGQLFRDIAVAISVSVMLSLVVAMTVIPALSSRLLGGRGSAKLSVMPLPIIDPIGRGFSWLVQRYVVATTQYRLLGFSLAAAMTGAAIWGAITFLPKLEYLPEGNRNLVFGIIVPPPGYNLDTMTGIAENIENVARPLWEKEENGDPSEPPAMDNFFFVAFRGNTFLGGSSQDPSRVAELIPVLSTPIFSEPGTFGFINQRSLFGRGIGGGRAIELNVSGDKLEDILGVALRAAGRIGAVFPRQEGNQFRPQPGLELGSPEVRLAPDRVRLADAGVDAQTLALTVDAFNDGLRVDEITVGADRLDLMLKGEASLDADGSGLRTQDIGEFPVVTPSGRIVPASRLAEVVLTAGPTEIRHRERFRTVTLELRPSAAIPLETALEIMRTEVMQPLEEEAAQMGVNMSLSGAADELSKTWAALQINLLLAMVIVFLAMAVLFESFILPLVIMVSVPVAGAGGVAGLAVLNLYQPQPLDMLTLLGFVILIGIVVNNAILIVHQSLYHLREEGMSPQAAIQEASRNRIRPIFMSTLTSVFGMLPLVVFPGAGSELYRGLGSVVVGGLSMSALLTLLLVPALLRLALSGEGVPVKAGAAAVAAAPAE